jgi:hypothetical protein
MIIVLDDIHFDGFEEIIPNMPEDDSWFNFDQHPCVDEMLKIAGKYFDLSEAIGYEMHKNVTGGDYKLEYHIDKDEQLFSTTGILSLPLCSIVYYPKIEDMQGGDLVFDDLMLKPITNRFVMFSSHLPHGVKDHSGSRLSVGINPWKEKPVAYR